LNKPALSPLLTAAKHIGKLKEEQINNLHEQQLNNTPASATINRPTKESAALSVESNHQDKAKVSQQIKEVGAQLKPLAVDENGEVISGAASKEQIKTAVNQVNSQDPMKAAAFSMVNDTIKYNKMMANRNERDEPNDPVVRSHSRPK